MNITISLNAIGLNPFLYNIRESKYVSFTLKVWCKWMSNSYDIADSEFPVGGVGG